MGGESKNSVLIVDDEISNLRVLTHILSQDYTIYTAKNGENALQKAARYRPDIILLDIVMPGIDGYQVLAELKKTAATEKIPVIIVTGLSSVEDEQRGLSLNAADYISKPFSSMIVRLRVRNQVQIVNQLRTIERLSMLDQLTGVPNRRSFDERIEAEWKRAAREHSPTSILVMDIDRFKNYNDTYGHQQGDAALREIAGVLSRSLKRPSDFVSRWGGEEFVALLPGTPLDGAMEIAEGMRRDVEAAEIAHGDGSVSKVTISIGVNTQVPAQSSLIDPFISAADKALYGAKAAGRNKVIHAPACEPQAAG